MKRLTWAGLTDVGRRRKENEDAFVVDPDLGLYVVCDGMGGHASGEIASAATTEEVHGFIERRAEGDRSLPYRGTAGATEGELVLSNAIQKANDRVFVMGMREPRLEGMGTTIVAMSEWQDHLVIAHVGDSRVYRFRDGALELVTRDHSLLNHQIDMGQLRTEEEIANFRHGNVIVRAIGLKDYVTPETAVLERVPGDLYLLCSDGLTDMVDDWSIENVLDANYDDLEEAAEVLVRMANDRGGKDNITVVLVRVDDAPEASHGLEDTLHEEEYFSQTPPPLLQREEVTVETRAIDFMDIDADREEITAQHTPIFAWEDDDDSEEEPPPLLMPRARPAPPLPPPPPPPARRMQPTSVLPPIVIDDD